MENTGNKNDWSKRDIGALWKRESATQKYLSGYVKVDELGIERELKVIVFSNKNKKDNAKAPDYRVYLSVPKEEKPAIQAENKAVKANPAKVSVAKKQVTKEVPQEEEEIL